jgi:hypothetical protein
LDEYFSAFAHAHRHLSPIMSASFSIFASPGRPDVACVATLPVAKKSRPNGAVRRVIGRLHRRFLKHPRNVIEVDTGGFSSGRAIAERVAVLRFR